MMDKKAFRKYLLQLRATIDAATRQLAATATVQCFEKTCFFAESDSIAAYIPVNDEFNSIPLIELIWQAGKKCYLPALSPDEAQQLVFFRYNHGDTLKPNRYGILEPESGDAISATQLDIVLVPLLGFDASGHRLGTGGGYYDRTFAFLNNIQARRCHLIGLGFSAQKVDRLPSEPWDVLLDGVLTEEGLHLF